MAFADLVLRGGSVWTAGWPAPRPGGVAVRDGRIAAVGAPDSLGDLIGPSTRVVEVAGGLVLPGFQDAHVHPDYGGMVRTQADLHDLPGVEAYQEVIRSYAESHPEAEWILGGGWALPHFPGGCPSKEQLDAAVADRPAYLQNRDVHGAWVNSRALEIAGLTADSPDPPDGRIERNPDGSLQGTLHEGAMDLVEDLIPPPTNEQLVAALTEAQSYLHSLGITAWQDAWATVRNLDGYRAMVGQGSLSARVVAAMWWDRGRGMEQVEELIERRRAATGGRLQATAVKIMQDGISENFTAGMLEPYLEPQGRSGLSFLDPAHLNEVVARLDREGFQVHVHAIGDRAVREALDAFEAARTANGPNDHRHHVAHLQVIHPDDVPRFAALNVTANAQPYWACLDDQMQDLVIPFLGPERVGHQYPFRSLRAAGGRLGMGSDWPVSTPDVMKEVQVAVTRVPFGEPSRDVYLPEERLSLAQSLEAFTAGSAFVNHLDHETGSLDEGKLADLTVLDRDPFELPPEEIATARVVMTLVEGQPVFEGDSLEGN